MNSLENINNTHAFYLTSRASKYNIYTMLIFYLHIVNLIIIILILNFIDNML